MEQAVFSFGPDETVFQRAGAERLGEWAPKAPDHITNTTQWKIQSLRNNQTLRELFCVMALGTSITIYKGDEEGYFHNYRDGPDNLLPWLVKQGSAVILRDVPTLSISLGLNESYFASDARGYTHDKLPDSLKHRLDQNLKPYAKHKRPICVALGVNETWVYVDHKGKVYKSLWGYNDLDTLLDEGVRPIYISLSTFSPGYYFVAYTVSGSSEPKYDFKVPYALEASTTRFVQSKPFFSDSLDGAMQNLHLDASTSTNVGDLQAEIARLKRELQQTKLQLENKTRNMTSEATSHSKNLKSANSRISELQTENTKLETDLNTYKGYVEGWREMYEKAESERAQAVADRDCYKSASNDWKEAYQSVKAQNASQALEIRRARSSSNLPAASMLSANAIANRDFVIRQQLQSAQFQQQQAMTTQMNIATMNAATMMNAASMPIW